MTIKEFKIIFENSETFNLKSKALELFINTKPQDIESIEAISNSKDILDMIKEEEEIENDRHITLQIENNLYQLWNCIETNYPFIKGEDYWVRIDDMSNELNDIWSNIINDNIKSYINNIKPIIWIISDNGLGTRKKKIEFKSDLNRYFKKI